MTDLTVHAMAVNDGGPLVWTAHLCPGFVWVGNGAVDFEGNGIDDTWACVRQAPDEDQDEFATLGDIAFTLDGVLQPFDIVPAEARYGCDIEVAVL